MGNVIKKKSRRSVGVAPRLRILKLRSQLGMTQTLFSRLMPASVRAVAGWEAGRKMNQQSQRRLREIDKLQKALGQIMKVDFISEWLDTPNEAFGNLKPIEVIERGETDRIWEMIFRLQSGMPI